MTNFADHIGNILVIDATDLAQRCNIALRQQIEIFHQRLHGRIVTIALA